MSCELSSFEQLFCGVSYIDCSAERQLSVCDILTPLLKDSVSLAQQNNSRTAKIIRVVIDEQQLQNQLVDINAALQLLKTEAVQIVCEIVLSTEQLRSAVDDKGQRDLLLQLAQHSNLLICEFEIFTLITQTTGPAAHNQLENSQLLNGLSVQAVLLRSGHGRWLYCTTSNWGLLSFADKKGATGKQSALTTAIADHSGCGSLSAAISAFMITGKRRCDAIVLALAFLQQNADPPATGQRLQPQAKISFGGWPCDLASYPKLDTGLTSSKITPFASTNTLSLGLYPVVDTITWLEKLLELGVKTIQLRIKDTADEQLEKLVAKAAQLGKQYQARLFINDYWQLAIKYQCYGVHLGQEDLDDTDLSAIAAAGLCLGVSTHSEYEWLRAIAVKPSYIAMGTVYPTQTKPAILIGLTNLQRWSKTLARDYPLVAIGGIKLDNIEPVLASGVGSVAVVTAITLAEDYRLATEQLTQLQQAQRRV
ncbi:MAG: hypothetical protein OFPI_05000 [Osedax symbiont Rs2]|nr:MAG: hypothetical protein OFPI_05000 [Osedax symbiont Rs2]